MPTTSEHKTVQTHKRENEELTNRNYEWQSILINKLQIDYFVTDQMGSRRSAPFAPIASTTQRSDTNWSELRSMHIVLACQLAVTDNRKPNTWRIALMVSILGLRFPDSVL